MYRLGATVQRGMCELQLARSTIARCSTRISIGKHTLHRATESELIMAEYAGVPRSCYPFWRLI